MGDCREIRRLGWAAIHTARAAQEGADPGTCRRIAEEALENTGVVGTVNTLKYLHRAGRIGGASRFLGASFGEGTLGVCFLAGLE